MSNVGYVLITYGVVDAICSATFGNFIQYVGRVPIFLGGAFLNIICLVILWTWTPNPDQSYVFFFIAALWGAGDAVWQTQINGEFLTANFFLIGMYLVCIYMRLMKDPLTRPLKRSPRL